MLKDIIKEIKSGSENVTHTVVFVPEGFEKDDKTESGHLINNYTKILSFDLKIRARQFGKTDRETVINQFRHGKIHVLTAMKMLDEGVDIPEIKRAIFCSSTGNPRQYIQRRGRILRKPKLDGFEKDYAEVYDMIVCPNEESYWDFTLRQKSANDKNGKIFLEMRCLESSIFFMLLTIFLIYYLKKMILNH